MLVKHRLHFRVKLEHIIYENDKMWCVLIILAAALLSPSSAVFVFNKTAMLNKPVALQCPKSEKIEWFHQNRIIRHDRKDMDFWNDQLFIWKFDYQHAGAYHCSHRGKIYKSFNVLVVEERPLPIIFINETEGSPPEFICQSTGVYPLPKLSWRDPLTLHKIDGENIIDNFNVTLKLTVDQMASSQHPPPYGHVELSCIADYDEMWLVRLFSTNVMSFDIDKNNVTSLEETFISVYEQSDVNQEDYNQTWGVIWGIGGGLVALSLLIASFCMAGPYYERVRRKYQLKKNEGSISFVYHQGI